MEYYLYMDRALVWAEYKKILKNLDPNEVCPPRLLEMLAEHYQRHPDLVLKFAETYLKTNEYIDGDTTAWMLFWHSWALHVQAKYLEACTNAARALDIFKKLKNLSGEIRTLNSLMVNHVILGRIDEAVEFANTAEELAEHCGDDNLLKTILVNTSKIHLRIGSIDEAYSILVRAMLIPAFGQTGEIPVIIAHSECLYHFGQLSEAEQGFARAIEKAESVNLRSYLAEACMLHGLTLLKLGDLEKAELDFTRAALFAQDIKDIHLCAQILLYQGQLQCARDNCIEGRKLYFKALKLSIKTGDLLLELEVHKTLASMYEEKQAKKALFHYKAFHAIETGIFTQKSTKAIEKERKKRSQHETESYKQLYTQIEIISDIGQQITASLNFEDVILILQKEIHLLMPAETFGLAVYNEEKRELDYSFFVEDGKRLPIIHVPVDTGTTLGAWCMRTGQIVYSNNIEEDWPRFLDFQPVFPIEALRKSLIFIPLTSKAQRLGVLSVQASKENAFSHYQLDALRALASYISIALENSQLFTTVKHRASYDMLTGILNRSSIFEKGEDAFLRLKRYGGKLSLLMIDIDHFKQINDTWGHLSGDKVLVEIATILKKPVRDCDYLGRYGGEEFLAILPETDLAGAQTLAERMRVACMNHNILLGKEGSVSCTLSIGIHEVDINDDSFEASIRKTDTALYWCKHNGRNCCHFG